MLFVTNRFPKGSIQTRVNRKFIFDLKNNAPSNSVFFCTREEDGQTVEIGGLNFLSKLKQSHYNQILLYIHGFSNLPDDIFEAAAEFQTLCNNSLSNEVAVVPIIWPCDNDLGIIKDYWDDQKSADCSAPAFARSLCHFLEWRNSNLNNPESDPCLKRINVLAHSMGCRVLKETLSHWDRYDLASGVPLIFRNTFLVAADIENQSLHRDESGSLICDASRNVVVYYASDDLALRSSKAANLKNRIASKRLGHSGPENIKLTPSNVYAVDCDELNNIYDFPKGHSYFRSGREKGKPGLVFEHMFNCMLSGRVFPENGLQRSTVLRE